jgi:hypothetical protein
VGQSARGKRRSAPPLAERRELLLKIIANANPLAVTG